MIMCLLLVKNVFAQDTVKTIYFPVMTVQGEHTQPMQPDTIRYNRSDWEIPGITIRSMGASMPVRIGILGAPPGGTLLKIDGIAWNDPRSGLADLSELPHWPIEELTLIPGTVSGAQGGIVSISLLSPAKWKGWNFNLSSDSEHNRTGEFLWSGGTLLPLGFSARHQWHNREGAFPGTWERRRDRFVGNETTQLYLTTAPHLSPYPLQTALSYHTSRNDLPGLVGRPVESKTEETKTGMDATIHYDSPVTFHARIGWDKTRFLQPALQPTPFGLSNFIPSDERTEWRGSALTMQYHHILPFVDIVQEELSSALDWVRYTDEYAPPTTSKSAITQRTTLIGSISSMKTLRQVRFQPWLSGRFQTDGGKWQPSDKSVIRYTGELATGITLLPKMTITVRAGDALRWQTLTEMYLAPNVYAAGNPNLEPEHSQEIQGEWRWHPTPVFGISGLLYARDTQNGIVWKQNYRGQFVPRNLLHTISQGGTGKLMFRPVPALEVKVSGARTDSWNATDGDINFGNRMPLIPLYQLDATVERHTRWKQSEPYIAARWFYQSRRFLLQANTDALTNENNDLPDEAVVDITTGIRHPITVSGTLTEFDLELSIRNIFDRHRWALEGVPLPDRTILFTVAWKKGTEQ